MYAWRLLGFVAFLTCAVITQNHSVVVLANQPEPADVNALKDNAVSEVEAMAEFTQQAVDSIFSFSELGFQEFETSKYNLYLKMLLKCFSKKC